MEKIYDVLRINTIDIYKNQYDIDIVNSNEFSNEKEQWLYELLLELSKDEKYCRNGVISLHSFESDKYDDLYNFLLDYYIYNSSISIDVEFLKLKIDEINLQ
jgi:hypothetical protein